MNLTTKPEVSRTLFDRYLLGRLRTDGHQIWREGRGQARKGPRGTYFHRNQCVAMVTWKNWFFWRVFGLIDPNMGARVRNEGEKTHTTVAMETCCHSNNKVIV